MLSHVSHRRIGALPSGRGPTFFVLLPEYDVGGLLGPYSREHLRLSSESTDSEGNTGVWNHLPCRGVVLFAHTKRRCWPRQVTE